MIQSLHPGRAARSGGTDDPRADLPAASLREAGEPGEDGSEARRIEKILSRRAGRGRLRLYYQPIFEVSTGNVFGAEALLRWTTARGETRNYQELCPSNGNGPLPSALDLWVLEKACTEARRWELSHPLLPLRVFVNLSDSRLRDAEHLAQHVHRILHTSGLKGYSLGLEISEKAVMSPAGPPMASLQRLRSLGASVALDDFGTGYSSLSRLSSLPTDYLKLDKWFIEDLDSPDSRSGAVIEAVVRLSHSFGTKIVAEGVETSLQLQKLRDAGCDLVQGYHLSVPLTSEDFARLLSRLDSDNRIR